LAIDPQLLLWYFFVWLKKAHLNSSIHLGIGLTNKGGVTMKVKKSDQTIYERAEVCEKVVLKARDLLKKVPLDVIGHQDSLAYCCRNGTVALVKLDLDRVVQPTTRKRGSK
jgi:hypothetical protein